MTEEKRLSLGINVSILLILMIFGVLLSLPLRLLFNTSYSNQNGDDSVADPAKRESVIPMDHRKLKRCPNLEYEDRLMSVFLDDYDENCTYVQDDEDDDDDNDDDNDDDDDDDDDDDSEEEKDSRQNKEKTGRSKRKRKNIDEENVEEILKSRQMKSTIVAGHILVAMLLVSVIAALVEVLRIRFAREKDSSRAGTFASRRSSSSVDIRVTRRLISRELIRSQRSFDIPTMHQSTLRLLGARPPPLIRRSSFPTPQAKQVATSSVCGTPINRSSRRQSSESDEETVIVAYALHHRIRLIRRH
ncbi:hypothetical protein DMN91_009132 [Ooceraea biroi]|uniref:Uncharacterized protein n=1 Tax=Ooceraea biroi TaxID=2015173 RepID=A0A3L8DEB4_OOCBI|nr:hypothetical protein DMN91_009132 [Ooceraea biroi]